MLVNEQLSYNYKEKFDSHSDNYRNYEFLLLHICKFWQFDDGKLQAREQVDLKKRHCLNLSLNNYHKLIDQLQIKNL